MYKVRFNLFKLKQICQNKIASFALPLNKSFSAFRFHFLFHLFLQQQRQLQEIFYESLPVHEKKGH